MIAGVHVTPEVIASFSRGRSLTMLSEQLPDVSPDLLLQAFSAIEGLDMHTVRLHMDGGGAVREIKLEGEEIDAYKIKTTPNEPAVRQGQKVADSPLRSFPAASDGGDEQLGKADLDVLKQLPASDAQRAAS